MTLKKSFALRAVSGRESMTGLCREFGISRKAGLINKRKRRAKPQGVRLQQSNFEPTAPNDLWTVDFKGWWLCREQKRCEPLTISDAFSRYVLCARPLRDTKTQAVREAFEEIFERHGLPKVIRSDNGSPFASKTAPLGQTRLSVWWVCLGISLDRIDPGRPDQNGAHERLHRDIALEVEATKKTPKLWNYGAQPTTKSDPTKHWP